MRSPISDVVGFIVERKRSLFDIFHCVERGKYPLLWNESVKLRTILATTVSCEQSFSVIKNTLHKNKKTATVFANVTAKYKQTKEVMVVENEKWKLDDWKGPLQMERHYKSQAIARPCMTRAEHHTLPTPEDRRCQLPAGEAPKSSLNLLKACPLNRKPCPCFAGAAWTFLSGGVDPPCQSSFHVRFV